MKITISQKTKIIIEIDFPDQSDESVSKTNPKKPSILRQSRFTDSNDLFLLPPEYTTKIIGRFR
jgi:hypothetical protein